MGLELVAQFVVDSLDEARVQFAKHPEIEAAQCAKLGQLVLGRVTHEQLSRYKA